MKIVKASPGDAPALSAIAWAAKAVWGYPSLWMDQWREQLTITPDFISENETFAAVVDRQKVAFYALLSRPAALRLEHLWVLPERIGQDAVECCFCTRPSALEPRAQPALRLKPIHRLRLSIDTWGQFGSA